MCGALESEEFMCSNCAGDYENPDATNPEDDDEEVEGRIDDFLDAPATLESAQLLLAMKREQELVPSLALNPEATIRAVKLIYAKVRQRKAQELVREICTTLMEAIHQRDEAILEVQALEGEN
jgi:hypothetical protein